METFKSTELKEGLPPAFVNGDDPACSKTLTNPEVSERALKAVFHNRPSYFSRRQESSETESKLGQ
jgi:hypothetical protein